MQGPLEGDQFCRGYFRILMHFYSDYFHKKTGRLSKGGGRLSKMEVYHRPPHAHVCVYSNKNCLNTVQQNDEQITVSCESFCQVFAKLLMWTRVCIPVPLPGVPNKGIKICPLSLWSWKIARRRVWEKVCRLARCQSTIADNRPLPGSVIIVRRLSKVLGLCFRGHFWFLIT